MDFEVFNLHPSILDSVAALGYETPTPIQQRAIPPILAGRDVLGLAQTGTGKTAAFVLPILQCLRRGPRKRIQALILAPTRELAQQIEADVQALGQYSRVHSMTIYGGVNINHEIDQLYDGVEVVVACPGRLLDHLDRDTVDFSLLRVLVLDEADRMLDMGFLPQIHRVVKFLPVEHQTLLFSATMPASVRELADRLLVDPVTIQVGEVAPVPSVEHRLYPVPAELKSELLYELLYRHRHETRSVLVFASTRHRAGRLAERLDKWGHRVACLQGNLSQRRRQRAIEGFRDGTYQILVATDIAARGIDVPQVSHVVNYDIPATPDDYLHRIGRTGRAGATGVAFTFFTPDEADMLSSLEHLVGESLTRYVLEGFDYAALP